MPTNESIVPPPLPIPRDPFAFAPLEGSALDALLKRPGSLVYQLNQPGAERLLFTLGAATVVLLALDGLGIGSFSGGAQWWAAPAKTVGGTLLSALICLPSLYIFSCLTGADIRLKPVAGALLASLCLNALLLIAFTPVAWVFSASSDSVLLIGTLYLAFWGISLSFALRVLNGYMKFIGAIEKKFLQLWTLIFLLVCLQMTTALRPFVGRSDTFFPAQKQFFFAHWMENAFGEAQFQTR